MYEIFRKQLESLSGYRFTGSSLLVIYDGSAMELAMDRMDMVGSDLASSLKISDQIMDLLISDNLVDVKMVDFAKSTLPGFLEDNPFRGPDEGYLFGLDHLISIVSSTLSNNI